MQMGLMKINDWDISECNARLWNATFKHCEISNENTWISGALSPILFSNEVTFKRLKITILVKGSTRDEILQNRSTLLSKFIIPVTLKMEWFSHNFYGTMIKHSETENSKNRFHTVEIELEGIETSEIKTTSVEDTKEITIEIEGNLPIPIILEITPIEGTGVLNITGCTIEPIKIKKTNQGKRIVINGMTGEMSEDGENKAADIEIWELPHLFPGENMITLDYAADITVRYQARYI